MRGEYDVKLQQFAMGRSLFAAIYCPLPPDKPANGVVRWDGNLEYLSTVQYTCGPYGSFLDEESGLKRETATLTCAWNQLWEPQPLDPCISN